MPVVLPGRDFVVLTGRKLCVYVSQSTLSSTVFSTFACLTLFTSTLELDLKAGCCTPLWLDFPSEGSLLLRLVYSAALGKL